MSIILWYLRVWIRFGQIIWIISVFLKKKTSLYKFFIRYRSILLQKHHVFRQTVKSSLWLHTEFSKLVLKESNAISWNHVYAKLNLTEAFCAKWLTATLVTTEIECWSMILKITLPNCVIRKLLYSFADSNSYILWISQTFSMNLTISISKL